MKTLMRVVLATLLAVQVLPLRAGEIGDVLPPLSLTDLSGNPRTIDDTVRRIYASADRKGDGVLKAALAQDGQAALDAQGAVVISDISAAPGFVKGIIKSDLKDRRYATWLDVSGRTKSALRYKADQVTVVELEQQRITAIRYAATAEALQRELRPAPATP